MGIHDARHGGWLVGGEGEASVMHRAVQSAGWQCTGPDDLHEGRGNGRCPWVITHIVEYVDSGGRRRYGAYCMRHALNAEASPTHDPADPPPPPAEDPPPRSAPAPRPAPEHPAYTFGE